MAAFNFFDVFTTDLANGTHANALTADTDVLAIYLTDTAPDAALQSVKADLAEIATGNGYTGPQDAQNSHAIASGVITVSGVDVTVTAAGGSVGPFRYVVLFNNTPASPADPLIGWWDYGSEVTLAAGESFTTDFDPSGSNVLFTIP